MALTKVLRGGLSTGVSDSSDATAITIDSSENVMMGGATSATSDITVGTASTDKRGIFIGSNQYRLGLKNASNNEVWLGSNGANSFTVSNASGSTLINVDSSGNIVLPTSSAGIYLGVTSDTASNLLDDYEEGTWTPTWHAGFTSLSYGLQRASYTKVGNIVSLQADFKFTGTSSGSALILTGLPFTSGSTGNGFAAGSGTISYATISTYANNANPLLYVQQGNTLIYFYTTAGASVSSNSNASNDWLQFTAIYQTET